MSVSSQTLKAVVAFIPSNTARMLAANKPVTPGQEIPGAGVALFADVAGFTPMAEQLVNLMAAQGEEKHRGAEELTRIINLTFTALIKTIHRYGGEVTRFSGDALAAYFPAPAPQNPQVVIHRAVQCAAHMQEVIKPLNPAKVEDQTFPISIKIGLSYGPAITIFLGAPGRYMDVVLAGPALDNATQAEHHAARGDIILSAEMRRYAPNLRCAPVADGFLKLLAAPETSHLIHAEADVLKDVKPKDYDAFLEKLIPFLPQTIYRQTIMTGGEIPGDYRRVSNIFVVFEGLNYTEAGAGRKLQAYVNWAYETVSRFNGTLLRVLTGDKGSGLHITFGAPDQHPNDIERALRCAMALRDDPKRPAFIINQKIGLSSGLVFTAAIGSPDRREYTVMGDEINLSARLMTATAPETILVDSYSQQRTAQGFEFSALPPLTLKGKTQPVTAYLLLAEREKETGLEARFLTSRWPIVGRNRELADCLGAADQALNGKGHIIALSGNLGVGKTRLIEEVVRYWIKNNGNGFMGQCSQHLQNNPYQAWIGFWHNFFHLSPQTPAADRRARIAAAVSECAPEMLPWIDALCEILGLPIAPDAPLLSLTAEERRQKLYQLSLALLKARARQQPLLILFEDLHWVDESSANLIDYLAPRIKSAPILLCLLFRSTHNVPVEAIALSHCTWHILEDLKAEDTGPLIAAILGQAVVSPEIAQIMFDKTQGTPLYVEEILNNLIARGALEYDGQEYIFPPKEALAQIPDTLQDLIRARLDRLEAQTRDLAQVAAVISREFSFNLLCAVYPYPLPVEQIQSHVDQLLYNDITTLTQPQPNPNYFFKHALTYEVAYNSLAFARRQTLHKEIAGMIEARYAANIEEFYNLLAYHYHHANILGKALFYTIKAGRRAQSLYANKIAMAHYHQATSYLETVPMDEHWPQAVELFLHRAQLHRLNVDMPAAEADLNRAAAIAAEYNDPHSLAQVHNQKAEIGYYQEQANVIQQEAQKAYTLVKADDHSLEKATALYHLGVADMMSGQFDQALDYLQQAHSMSISHHYSVLESEALNKIATVQFFDGYLEWALQAYNKVYASRQQLGLKDKEAETLSNIATLQFRLNQPEHALATAAQAIQLAQEAGWQLLIPYVKLLQVELLTHLGRYDEAENTIAETYPLFAPDDEVGNAYAKLTHGRDILLDRNHFDEAAELLAFSLEVTQKYNIYEEMARTLVSLGTLHSRKKQWAKAQAYFLQAETICQEHHTGWYLSEIYTRLAEAMLKQKNFDDALTVVKAGLYAIQNRSNPDWQGTLLALNADIAQHKRQSPAEVTRLYQDALKAARVRSRAINRYRLFLNVGTKFLSNADPAVRASAEALIREGISWLQQHGSRED